jgi:hypothetical protein
MGGGGGGGVQISLHHVLATAAPSNACQCVARNSAASPGVLMGFASDAAGAALRFGEEREARRDAESIAVQLHRQGRKIVAGGAKNRR